MTRLEIELRLSVIQAELCRLAEALPHSGARIVRYAANILGLLRRGKSGGV